MSLNCLESFNPTWLSAIGSILVAISAIFGDYFRNLFLGPKLKLELFNPKGDLNSANGIQGYYYHIKVKNGRKLSPAKHVRILLTSLARKISDKFCPELLVIPVQLTWPYPKFTESTPTIITDKICDIGFLAEGSDRFLITTYIVPNNFKGYILKGETLRLGIIAEADNFSSKTTFFIDITWDGQWSSKPDEMVKHLIINEIISGD